MGPCIDTDTEPTRATSTEPGRTGCRRSAAVTAGSATTRERAPPPPPPLVLVLVVLLVVAKVGIDEAPREVTGGEACVQAMRDEARIVVEKQQPCHRTGKDAQQKQEV